MWAASTRVHASRRLTAVRAYRASQTPAKAPAKTPAKAAAKTPAKAAAKTPAKAAAKTPAKGADADAVFSPRRSARNA
jgi:hypothetical protein